MDVKLSIGDEEEIWKQRRQRLEALMGPDLSEQQNDPAQPEKIMDPSLFLLAKKGDVDMFIRALNDHCAKERVSLPVLLGLRSTLGDTLLHSAAESDDNVKAIIGFAPQQLIFCKNSRGETPLHIAARAGKNVAVKLLLLRGIPRDTDCCGNSVLHEAVRSRHHKVIDQLVSKDPSLLYCQNKESKSPLCVAIETKDLEVLKLLLDALNDGEDWRRSESQRIFGMSPVHFAIIHSKEDMLIEMWEKKPWLFQLRDAGQGTPLHLAAYCNYFGAVKFLMEKCPTSALEQDSTDGYLPIHVACMMNHVKIIKELLQQWPDPPEFPTKLGQNILHVSARYGSMTTVRYILKNPKLKHLINAKDFEGNTPLHLATLHRQPSVVLLARDKRVDLKLVNNNNMTALDIVEQDIKQVNPPIGKKFTWITLASASTPRSGELAILKPTGRSPWKRLEPPELKIYRDQAKTCSVVVALAASVTFTSGFDIPGGYDGSKGDAGTPILLHKAMYNVFVICNSSAMYSSITALAILLWSHVNDPYMVPSAIYLSNPPMFVTLITMPLAFMAGVYLTVSELPWLSTFVLVMGSVVLYIILSILILLCFPLRCRHPLIRVFSDRLLICGLAISRRETAGSGTAEREATSVRGTREDNERPPLE